MIWNTIGIIAGILSVASVLATLFLIFGKHGVLTGKEDEEESEQ